MTFIKIITITLCLWSLYDGYTGLLVDCPDGWSATGNHCYQQVAGTVVTEAEAKTKCAALGSGSVPVTVHSDTDNKDLAGYLTDRGDTSFYIGLEYKAGTPLGEWDWLDGGNAKNYHLWDKTTDDSGALPCVYCNQVGKVMSGWFTNDCKQPMKSVVCQAPSRSFDTLYKELQQVKDLVRTLVSKVDKAIVPVGFIYVQFPNQVTPTQLWGTESKWSDVTESYAGLFFRAEGGGSAVFNPTGVTVQTANLFNNFTITASAINGVTNSGYSADQVTQVKEQVKSGNIVPGETAKSALYGMEIFIDDKDAHPKNTAIKIWRRTA